MTATPRVVYTDNHLLVVEKPAGWVSQGAGTGQKSLVDWAKAYIKRKYAKPGNVYLGVVHRLDASVTGLVVFGRTSKAADRLTNQFRERTVNKIYLALVEGSPPDHATLVDHLVREPHDTRTRVVPSPQENSAEARLEFKMLWRLGACTLVEIHLETGRKHQIRAQFAHRNWPVVGDRRYGSRFAWNESIALHAWKLEFDHPTQKQRMSFSSPIPQVWRAFDRSLADFSA